MKISGFKRLVKEDFPPDQQGLVEKLATVFNLFQEQVYYAFNNNISLSENILAQTISIKMRVDATGHPIGNDQIKYTLKTRPRGAQVIAANNITDTSGLSGAPFLVFALAGDIITISQVTGLIPGKDYDLTVVFYGT